MNYSPVDATNQADVNIKGTTDGLIIHLGAGEWNTLLATLADRLDKTPSFFRGGRVALNVGPRQLTVAQMEIVGNLLTSFQITLWAVVSDSVETQRAAADLGLETSLVSSRSDRFLNHATEPALDEPAILVRRIVRSGQSLRHDGHVVVVGDVNPGAEIAAGGDVIIWGRLRGNVHAGLHGNDGAVVCALVLAPMLLRIGQHVARSPGREDSESYDQSVVPEMAFVHHNQIVAEPWRASEGLPFGADWRSDLLRRASNTLSTWF